MKCYKNSPQGRRARKCYIDGGASLSDLDGHSHVFLTFSMAWFMWVRPVVYISGSVNTKVADHGSVENNGTQQ